MGDAMGFGNDDLLAMEGMLDDIDGTA